MLSLTLPDGTRVPKLGQGTWRMGEDPLAFQREVEALRLGIELGLTLIDTAEMYGDGGAERVVGTAIRDVRDRVFVVTKVWPTHLRRDEIRNACYRSLERLGLSSLDAYLIHWPSRSVPLAETLEGLASLVEEGVVRHAGVSNFPTALLQDAQRQCPVPLVFDQVPYSLARREAEGRLLPYCRQSGVVVMAYNPVKHLPHSGPGAEALRKVADAHGVSPVAVGLRWLIEQEGVVAIPKAADPQHVRENQAVLTWRLDPEERALLEAAFPRRGEELPLQWM